MPKWEYLTVVLQAERRFSNEPKLPNYAVRALMPQLNQYGSEEWELVSATPQLIGDNEDVGFGIAGAAGTRWTHSYLCFFKRPCRPAPPH